MPERKITLDVLVEGPAGTLVFKPVRASRNDLKELVEASRNPVIRRNVFRPGTEKRVRI